MLPKMAQGYSEADEESGEARLLKARLAQEYATEARISRLKEESLRCARHSVSLERLSGEMEGLVAQFGRFADAQESMVGRVLGVIMPIKAAVLEMGGVVGEARQEIGAERGRIDNLTGFVLPRLGATMGGGGRGTETDDGASGVLRRDTTGTTGGGGCGSHVLGGSRY